MSVSNFDSVLTYSLGLLDAGIVWFMAHIEVQVIP